jgi:hypothetical protein
VSNCEKSDVNIDKVAKARISSLVDHNLGVEKEVRVLSNLSIKSSYRGMVSFFWYQISGRVVFSETESDGHDPRRCD